MNDQTTISCRFTERAFTLSDDIVQGSNYHTGRKSFWEESLSNNIGYVLEIVEGQKSIREFAKNLDWDIQQINLDIDSQEVRVKLTPNRDLSSAPPRLEITEKTNDKLNHATKSSGLTKSAVVRACVIKGIYDMTTFGNNQCDIGPAFSKSKSKMIRNRWLEIEQDLRSHIDQMIFQLYTQFRSDRMEEIFIHPIYANNGQALIDHYADFEGSSGYHTMREHEIGQTVLDQIETIVQEAESTVDQVQDVADSDVDD